MLGDRRAQCSEGRVPTGFIEALKHPASELADEGEGVVGVGSEAHRLVKALKGDVDEARGAEDGSHAIGVGRMRTDWAPRRWGREVAADGHGGAELGEPFVVGDALPSEECESTSGTQRAMEVGERRDRIAEEHRAHAGDHDVEPGRLERVDLRVGVPELDVVETFGDGGVRARASICDDRSTPTAEPLPSDSCDVAGGLSGAAADVEHVVAFVDGGGGEERAVAAREGQVESLGLGGPEGALRCRPRLRSARALDGSAVSGSAAGTASVGPVMTSSWYTLYRSIVYTSEREHVKWHAALTPTSYSILGLLALKPWTTYELAQQMERALGQFWPRAESRLYEEPKKLVAHGLARASSEMVGKRPRTIYTITAKGRRALAKWVATPGGGPVLEFEALIKVFFAEHASQDRSGRHTRRRAGVERTETRRQRPRA